MTLEPFDLTEHLDEAGTPTELWATVNQRIARGFYSSPGTEGLQHWQARNNQNLGMRILGFLDTEPAPLGEGPRPIATLGAFDGRMTVGDETLTSRLITAVGVDPSYRRRGLLRKMMSRELHEAKERGLPLASLTVSEGSIYGRFGFGVGTRESRYRLDLTARPALRPMVAERSGADEGRIWSVAPEDLAGIAQGIYDRVAPLRTGHIRRFPDMEQHKLRRIQFSESSTDPDNSVLAFLYQGPEVAEGYAVVKHQGWNSQADSVVEVLDFQAATPRAEVGLWRHLMSLDLVDRIEFRAAPGADLRALIDNPRAMRIEREYDVVWNRVLDVPAVLQARQYLASGEVVVDVKDPSGLAAGAFHLVVGGGVGRVVASGETGDAAIAPGVPRAEFSADVLAEAVFRGCDAAARLGGVGGDGAGTAARLFAVEREPYCDLQF